MTEVQTAISAVTVYPDRARITRQGEVMEEPGLHQLEISNLPLLLEPASVRASAHGTARARLLGVDVKRVFYVDTPNEAVRQLEQEVEAVQDQINAHNAEGEGLKAERAALQGLQNATDVYARGMAFGKTTPADQMALFDRLRERAAGLDTQLQALDVRLRDHIRRLKKLQKELDQLRSARKKERFTATVEVEVTAAGNLTLELTYVVSGASWTPLYDMRLTADGSELEAGYLAEVIQSTGEEWSDVALILSTARPALAGTLPKLDPWFLHPPRALAVEEHMPPAPAMARAPVLQRMAATPAVEEDMVVYEAEPITATVRSEGAAVTYVLPALATIPPDGAPHKVTVARYPLIPELDYVSAPKLVEAAYRRAKVDNNSAYTLLAGTANLFVGDEFIGSTELELTAPGGEIELYLGVDDRVRVKRELKRRDVDKKMLSDRRRLSYSYEIEMKNLLDREVTLTLYDQIPISRHEHIKVRLESVHPKPAVESDLGLLEWELTLTPGEERTTRFDFVVEHPRTMRIGGLP